MDIFRIVKYRAYAIMGYAYEAALWAVIPSQFL